MQEVDKKEIHGFSYHCSAGCTIARCWREAEKIFSLYRDGNIKRQKRVKELGMPECRKCNWQFVHGLTEEQQFTLLSDLAAKIITFAQANTRTASLKTEEKVASVLSIS